MASRATLVSCLFVLVACADDPTDRVPVVAIPSRSEGGLESIEGLAPLSTQPDGRRPVPHFARREEGKRLDEDDDSAPTGRVVLCIDAPADSTVWVYCGIVDESPDGFRRLGHWRVLEDELTKVDWTWDRLTGAPAPHPEGIPALRTGDRVRVALPIEDLPLGRRLWACLFSLTGDSEPGALGHSHRVEEIPPLGPGDEPFRLELLLRSHGSLVGRVQGAEAEEDHDEDTWDEQPEEPDGSGQEPGRPWLEDLEVRLRGEGRLARLGEGGRWELGPLLAGAHELDLVARTGSGVQRRVLTAGIVEARTTDTGTWWLEHEEPTWILRATDPEASPLGGTFLLELRGYPPVRIGSGDAGTALLCGWWRDCTRIRFEPWDAAHFEPAAVETASLRGRLVHLLCKPRAVPLVRVVLKPVLPGGEAIGEAAWACMRASADAPWQPVFLGSASPYCASGTLWSDLLEPGPREVIAWLPKPGLASAGRVHLRDVETDPPSLFAYVEATFEDPRTLVRGRLRLTLEGVDACGSICALPVPRGATASSLDSIRAHVRNDLRGGGFELRGLPTGIDLDLLFLDDDGLERARRPVRLERGQTLDLGQVQVDLR